RRSHVARDRRAALQPSGPDFRPAEILQDRDLALRTRGSMADAPERRAVRLVRVVRKIQAEDVRPGRDERVEHRVRVAGGSDGGDDLRVPHRGCDKSLQRWAPSYPMRSKAIWRA